MSNDQNNAELPPELANSLETKLDSRFSELEYSLKKRELEFQEKMLELKSLIIKYSDKKETQNGAEGKKWWITLTQILGLPALVILMFLQFNQASSVKDEGEKARAEAQLAVTQELAARIELQEKLDNLEKLRLQGAEEYQKALDDALPKIRELLDQIEKTRVLDNIPILILKFFILWAIWIAISLIFQIIHGLWSPFIGVFQGTIRNLIYRGGRGPSRGGKILVRTVDIGSPILYSVPTIADWAISIVVFFALFVPFFDEVSKTLGSNLDFDSILESIKSLDIGGSIERIRSIINV